MIREAVTMFGIALEIILEHERSEHAEDANEHYEPVRDPDEYPFHESPHGHAAQGTESRIVLEESSAG
jgi:hypothetical protein